MIGHAIGPYRVEEKLGEGGVGEVFRALDTSLGRRVAIKRLRPELATRSQIVERFRSEAKTLARLNHPNIATLYALEEDGDALWMVIEYVDGETLAAILRRDGALAQDTAVSLFLQALAGIGYAHERGVIHRDIKGSNLMLNRDGVLKVMDFGIARALGSERMTLMGQLVGTPEFMSPEQIRGDDCDVRSDIYSLGILLYAMLSARVPFIARGGYDLLRAQVEETPAALSEHVPGVAPAIESAVARALAKAPEDRFQTTAAFAAALAAVPVAPLTNGANRATAQGGTGPQADPTLAFTDSEELGEPGATQTCVGLDDDAPTQISEPSPRVSATSPGISATSPGIAETGAATRVEPATSSEVALGSRRRGRRRMGAAALALTACVLVSAGVVASRAPAPPHARSLSTSFEPTIDLERAPTEPESTESSSPAYTQPELAPPGPIVKLMPPERVVVPSIAEEPEAPPAISEHAAPQPSPEKTVAASISPLNEAPDPLPVEASVLSDNDSEAMTDSTQWRIRRR